MFTCRLLLRGERVEDRLLVVEQREDVVLGVRRLRGELRDALLGALLLLLHVAELGGVGQEGRASPGSWLSVSCMTIDASASTCAGSAEVSRPASDVWAESS